MGLRKRRTATATFYFSLFINDECPRVLVRPIGLDMVEVGGSNPLVHQNRYKSLISLKLKPLEDESGEPDWDAFDSPSYERMTSASGSSVFHKIG